MKKIRLAVFISTLMSLPFLGSAQDSIIVTMIPIDTAINSAFSDYGPVINADGSIMMYTSNRPISEKGIKKGKAEFELVYMSTAIDSIRWNKGVVLGETINAKGRFNSPIALSNDGQRLLMYRDDPKSQGDIYESVLNGEEWGELQSLGNMVNTDAHETTACYAPDGKTLYFVSNRDGGVGGKDIWKTERQADGSFSVPVNLGAPINTKKDEEGVFMHPDGVTMYFSSNGHGGLGGFDLFKTSLSGGSFTEPTNLGAPINTEASEYFLVVEANGRVGYVTTEGVWGGLDIYKVRFDIISEDPELQAGLTLLKGVVTDEATGEPLEAEIELVNNHTGEIVAVFNSNSATGAYLISLPAGFDYGISVNAKGYLFHSENINIEESHEYQEVLNDIQLVKLDVGAKIVLNNIFYDYGESTLRPESKSELERLVRILEDNPQVRIEIGGHTDTRGSDGFNQKLSEDRAHSVVNYLIEHGIDESRLKYKGYGESQPVNSDAVIANAINEVESEQLHQENRRTELKVIE